MLEVPAAPVQASVGEAVSVSIRRDLVQVRRAGSRAKGDINTIEGIIEATEYQGNFVKIAVIIEGVDTFVANISDQSYFAEPVVPGDKVTVSWNGSNVHVMAKPDSGIAGSPYGG
jgi:putative spermidine/putrescine transport system ATP-binding protein